MFSGYAENIQKDKHYIYVIQITNKQQCFCNAWYPLGNDYYVRLRIPMNAEKVKEVRENKVSKNGKAIVWQMSDVIL